MTRPTLLFYCQHSLGLGHLTRSLALADGLAARFDVTLLNGGRLPAGTVVPPGVRIVNLPPLGHDDAYRLVSHDPDVDVASARRRRRRIVLDALAALDPAVVLIELFPFGRRKFAFELLPLLAAAHSRGPARPRVVCSVRDILVNQRPDQAEHDDRAARIVERYVDAVLVHADPGFARLEESFAPTVPMRVPVHHTGFVVPRPPSTAVPDRLPRLLVSTGGGMVGEPLVRAAVAVHARLAARTGLSTTVVAGPFLPDAAWARLREQASASPHLTALRRVEDLSAEMACSELSLSQGGYNSTMDLLRAGTPGVVVPYAVGREDEQTRRSARLAALGALRMLPADELGPSRLLAELLALRAFRPRPVPLDLSGRETSARIVARLAGLPAAPLEAAR